MHIQQARIAGSKSGDKGVIGGHEKGKAKTKDYRRNPGSVSGKSGPKWCVFASERN